MCIFYVSRYSSHEIWEKGERNSQISAILKAFPLQSDLRYHDRWILPKNAKKFFFAFRIEKT